MRIRVDAIIALTAVWMPATVPLASGIDFRWEAIEGCDETAAEIMPHACKAGPQTTLLKEKVEGMAEGGTFVMVRPPNPYRCPPGPYERVRMKVSAAAFTRGRCLRAAVVFR